MVTLFVKFALVIGANWTVSGIDAFGARVEFAAGAEVTVKGVSGDVRLRLPNVRVWLPVFVSNVFWLAVVPVTTLPKASDVGAAERPGPLLVPVPERPTVPPLPVDVVAFNCAE